MEAFNNPNDKECLWDILAEFSIRVSREMFESFLHVTMSPNQNPSLGNSPEYPGSVYFTLSSTGTF